MAEWWKKLRNWVLGLLWASFTGGLGATVNAIDDWWHYEGMIDWAGFQRKFFYFAIMGGYAWYQKHKGYIQGLFTPVPEDDTTK